MSVLRVSDINRFEKVTHVLIDSGFATLLSDINVLPKLSWFDKFRLLPEKQIHIGTKLQHACEQLGPVFTAFGHFLSKRPDLVNAHTREELAKLPVHPVDYKQIEKILKKEKLFSKFKSIDKWPLFVRPFFEAHRAVLKNNKEVIILVKHKIANLESDLDILTFYAHALEISKQTPIPAHFVVEEFKVYLQTYLDITNQIKNAKSLRNSAWKTPNILEKLSTQNVLVWEHIDARAITQVRQLRKLQNSHVSAILESSSKTLLHEFFNIGVFHTRIEAFNAAKNNTIVLNEFIDTQRVSVEHRKHALHILVGIVEKQSHIIVTNLLQLASKPYFSHTSVESLQLQIDRIIKNPIHHTSSHMLANIFLEILEVARVNHVQLSHEFVSFVVLLAQLEHLGKRYDPSFDTVVFSQPVLQSLQKEIIHANIKSPKKTPQKQMLITPAIDAPKTHAYIAYCVVIGAVAIAGSILLLSVQNTVLYAIIIPLFAAAFFASLFFARLLHKTTI